MEEYIPVKTRKETAKVSIREILYIESELRVVVIYTEKRKFRFYGKLDELIQYLSNDFYRIHKSCVINLDRIARMEDGVIYFTEEQTVRVGQNNYRLARRQYLKHLEQNGGRNS
jgi:DNA-binding LytR/AlgR family response regulator